MSKYLGKNISMYISMLYVLIQSFVKNRHFSWPMQKRFLKIVLRKGLFGTKFCTGYITNRFFLKQLQEHVGREHVHITFLFDFLHF
jgi:hypothetical protein